MKNNKDSCKLSIIHDNCRSKVNTMELSSPQKDAVECIGSPALVVAGAGSGKTRTLTAKIAHLISNGYSSERILAITFTNKAADEMKSRLVKLTGMPIQRFPWVRTYHSACFKILKDHCGLLGYSPPLQIYAEYQRQTVLKEIMESLNFDKKYTQIVSAHISNAKNSADPETYFDNQPYVYQIILSDVYDLYEKALKSKNAVDFDDILLLTRNLLRDYKKIRQHYQKLFEYLLVDEYQDTNNLQEELTRLLMHNSNLFCVGDDWQAIYSFRGSNVDHFLSFKKKYKGARIFRLEENYRSADEIVKAANELIGYNKDKMGKRCFSKKQGGLVEVHDFLSDAEEAYWVVKKVESFHEMDLPYDKIAVLYRTKFCSLAFEKAFRAFGISYQMLGGKGFFERKEILDINCYLTAAMFPKDDTSFERILNTPKRGIGPAMIKKINQLRSSSMSLQEAACKALSEKILTQKIYDSIHMVIQLLNEIKDMKPDLAIEEVLLRTNYMDYIKHYSRGNKMDYAARKENIEQLVYSASQKDTLIDYLEEAALIKEDKADDEQENTFGVALSTIHASKGLEYQVVFVVGCEEQLFPHWKSLETPNGLQEERRLMYVAMTRSEQFLFLSSANSRKGQFNKKSRFLYEIEESF